jgi:UDP-N-acetylglucosamine 2-epimerase (non-hydrolysing)
MLREAGKNLIVFGTRPEFIKLLPIISEIEIRGLKEQFYYVYTGQHTDLIFDLFKVFQFKPDHCISININSTSLSQSFTHIISGLQNIIDKNIIQIKRIIAQGDTTSCVCAAIFAFLNQIPFTHIEAGLRSGNMLHPYPEEFFRKIISLASSVHFAPSVKAKENLIQEGIDDPKIIVTGNTVVDAIKLIHNNNKELELHDVVECSTILITCHRRENQDVIFPELMKAVKVLARENPELKFIWIKHPAPLIQMQLNQDSFLGLDNVVVSSPLNVNELYSLYYRTKLIITDSGGIQEEAPSFNIPVIVIRKHTERMESVELGYSILVTDIKADLVKSFNKMKNLPTRLMKNPYGDGNATQRIMSFLKKH